MRQLCQYFHLDKIRLKVVHKKFGSSCPSVDPECQNLSLQTGVGGGASFIFSDCFNRYSMAVLGPAGCVFTEARQQTYHPRLPAGLFVSEATISRISKSTTPPFFYLKKC